MKTEYISLVVVAVETSICVLDILEYMDLNDCFFLFQNAVPTPQTLLILEIKDLEINLFLFFIFSSLQYHDYLANNVDHVLHVF